MHYIFVITKFQTKDLQRANMDALVVVVGHDDVKTYGTTKATDFLLSEECENIVTNFFIHCKGETVCAEQYWCDFHNLHVWEMGG